MNGQSTIKQLDSLRVAKAEAVAKYLEPNGNVVGIGIGKKQISGEWQDCLRIYVIKKQAEELIPPAQLVRKGTLISAVPVDVIQVGNFGRNGPDHIKDTGTITRPGSPIRVKTERSNINEGARGTLGAVLTDGEQYYILGCNHILAVNGRVPTDLEAAKIVSAEFVGNEKVIASRCDFVKLLRNTSNVVDCAIALLSGPKSVQTDFPSQTVSLTSDEVAVPDWGMRVSKVGAGTNFTRGQIVDVDVDLYVPYSFLDTVRFDHQIMIRSEDEDGTFATNGDSGALVVDEGSGQGVGMIFASSGQFAVANPLSTVLTELGYKVKHPLRLVVPSKPASTIVPTAT